MLFQRDSVCFLRLHVSSWFLFYDKLDDIIIHYLNYIFTHSVSARSSFICFVKQYQVRRNTFSQFLTDWINNTVQHVHWGDFIGLWNQHEQCSWPQSRVRQRCGGHQGLHRASLMDRQGTVNLEDQEPELCVFTSLLLPWCHHVVKRYSSQRPCPFVTIWEDKHRLSAKREMEAEVSVAGG